MFLFHRRFINSYNYYHYTRTTIFIAVAQTKMFINVHIAHPCELAEGHSYFSLLFLFCCAIHDVTFHFIRSIFFVTFPPKHEHVHNFLKRFFFTTKLPYIHLYTNTKLDIIFWMGPSSYIIYINGIILPKIYVGRYFFVFSHPFFMMLSGASIWSQSIYFFCVSWIWRNIKTVRLSGLQQQQQILSWSHRTWRSLWWWWR